MSLIRSSTKLIRLTPPTAPALCASFSSSASTSAKKNHSAPKPQKPQQPQSTTRKRNEPRYNYIPNPFDSTADPDAAQYRLVTAKELSTRSTPPRRVKMLARDFIDDCLYNNNYGYFSTQAVIFDPDQVGPSPAGAGRRVGKDQLQHAESEKGIRGRAEGFDFRNLSSTREFEDEISARYGVFEADGGEVGSVGKGPGRQVWHTPTELFKPWYGRALARYIVSEYKLNLFPYEDLIIYEIGAGNGTLMGDILDYIAQEEPEVYERTRYRIVEISERLQTLQKGRAMGGDGPAAAGGPAGRKGHAAKVEVLGGSIFDWERVVPEPCFFLALEVLDNFSHDVVRYSTETHAPLQCVVSVDSTGDYTELYEPVTDPLIARYLALRERTARPRSPALNPLLDASPLLRKIWASMPFAPNLTQPEFLPTKQLMLLDILRDKFPAHRILMSDFSSLPDAIPGQMAPVVQTRYEGETVACTTYLVQPGFFDIFFPTDFHQMAELYALVMKQSSAQQPSNIPASSSASIRVGSDFFSPHTRRATSGGALDGGLGGAKRGGSTQALSVVGHGEFLEKWGEVEMTRVSDGTNPMTESYENAKFIL